VNEGDGGASTQITFVVSSFLQDAGEFAALLTFNFIK
jgi:hypothetical protein